MDAVAWTKTAMLIDPSFWAGRRVLVTGHTGFKGGWLCLVLHKLGAIVSGLSLAPATQPNLFETVGLNELINSVIGDIRDLETVRRVFDCIKPEIVFHLAAQAIVRRAYTDSIETVETNVMGTANILEGIRHTISVRVVVLVTSDKVYENQEWPWAYRELDALGGKEPYGVSKACCELIASAWHHSYFIKHEPPVAMATVRAGNIIGGGDWAQDRLVPDAIRAFSAGVPLMIRNPKAVRPWQHVAEPVRGYLMLAERLSRVPTQAEGAWNFGPSVESVIPVAHIADQLANLWGDNARWELAQGAQPYEARFLTVDSSKANNQLGWKPIWTFQKALEHTVVWYHTFYTGVDVRQLTLDQINMILN